MRGSVVITLIIVERIAFAIIGLLAAIYGQVWWSVCEQTGRKCFGCEIDPKYCDVIRKRYWKFTHDGVEDGWEEGTKAL